jgi:hypothetical protein
MYLNLYDHFVVHVCSNYNYFFALMSIFYGVREMKRKVKERKEKEREGVRVIKNWRYQLPVQMFKNRKA